MMSCLEEARLKDANLVGMDDYHWATDLQEAAKSWVLKRAEYNVMATFTFRKDEGVSYGEAKWMFGLFVRRLRDALWGRRSNRKRRLALVPVVEDYKEQLQRRGIVDCREGTHIHCLMALPGDPMDYKEVVHRLWVGTHPFCGEPKVYCPDSDDWYVPITNEHLRGVYAGYILKRCQFDVDGLLVQYM